MTKVDQEFGNRLIMEHVKTGLEEVYNKSRCSNGFWYIYDLYRFLTMNLQDKDT